MYMSVAILAQAILAQDPVPVAQACSVAVARLTASFPYGEVEQGGHQPTLTVSTADAGDVNGRAVGCCFVAKVAGRQRGRAVRGDGQGPAPLRRRAVGCARLVASSLCSPPCSS